MELKKISRSKSFEMVNGYGLKSWTKFAIEGDLSEQESPLDAYSELGKIIDEAFKQEYPKSVEPPKEIQVKEPEPKLSKEEMQKKCLTDTTALDGPDGLKSFALLVKNNPYLQETYENHFKKLTDGL